MRNLKRVLALALALVMMLGMMITASAATYTDEAAIDADYADAVEILSGMGLFKGQSTTAKVFAPKAILTRAEAAALIYRAITGDVNDKQKDLYDYTSFADVQEGAWYTGYITYAANGGYIKGYAGNAMPNDTVTGIQVLAIMLRAAGYGQNGEYEGAAWKDNILTDAQELGITKGISTNDLDKGATRELVAQLIFNAIVSVDMVTYAPALGYIKPIGKAAETLGEKVFSLKEGTDRDEWGRPYYGWTYKVYNKAGATWFVEDHTTYTVAVSDCQIGTDMGLKKSGNVTIYNNGVKGETAIGLTNLRADNGGQGVQIEVYENEIVRIDTYLAEVTDVTEEVLDKNGHVKVPASTDLIVYKFNSTGIDPVMDGADYTKGDMILVNINEGAVDADGNYLYIEAANDDKVVTAVQLADSFEGTQTILYYNTDKHEIDDVVYDDALHFYLDPALHDGSKAYTWYMDQFGNLIGSAEIRDVYSYAVIKDIEWIDVVGNNDYVTATLVNMMGEESTATVKAIENITLSTLSYDIKDNYSKCGLHLYQVATDAKGLVTLTEVAELDNTDVYTGVSAIYGQAEDDSWKAIYTDNSTQYLVKTAVRNAGGAVIGYTYVPVTGYTNIGDFSIANDVVVDYVDLDQDGFVDYVYIIGTPDYTQASEFVFITSDANIEGYLTTFGGIDYYKVNGVVRADGSTDPLYIAHDAVANTTALMNWLKANVGKLFLVDTVNGYVQDIANQMVEVTDMATGTSDARTVAFMGINPVYSDGVLVVESMETGLIFDLNVTKTTAIFNENGVGTVKDLSAAALKNKNVYVVYNAQAPKAAVAVFVTDATANTVLDLYKANAVAALTTYAAATVDSDYINGIYADLTVADIQTTLDAQIAAVMACTTQAAVDAIIDTPAAAGMTGVDALDAAAIAAATAKANAEGASTATSTRGTTLDCVTKANASATTLSIILNNYKFDESMKVVLYTAEGKEIGSVAAVPNSHSVLLTGVTHTNTSCSWKLDIADATSPRWEQTGSADYLNVPAYATLFIDGEAVESVLVGVSGDSGVDPMTNEAWYAWLDAAL